MPFYKDLEEVKIKDVKITTNVMIYILTPNTEENQIKFKRIMLI